MSKPAPVAPKKAPAAPSRVASTNKGSHSAPPINFSYHAPKGNTNSNTSASRAHTK